MGFELKGRVIKNRLAAGGWKLYIEFNPGTAPGIMSTNGESEGFRKTEHANDDNAQSRRGSVESPEDFLFI